MPSNLLKKALTEKEDVVALIEMTYLIQYNQIQFDDIKTIRDTAHKANANNHAKYLLAALYFYGSPSFEKQELKGINMLRELKDKNYSYAKNLLTQISLSTLLFKLKLDLPYAEFFKENLKTLEEEKQNPLCVMNLLNLLTTSENISESSIVKEPMHDSTAMLRNTKNMDKMLDLIKTYLPTAYKVLVKTSYREQVDETIKLLTNYFSSYQIKDEKMSPSYTLFKETSVQQQTKALISAWLALASFHKEVNQRSLMFNALQHAVEINPKKKENYDAWLQELGGNHLEYKDIKNYLEFYNEMAKIAEKKLSTSQNDIILNNVSFNFNVEIKNCEFLYRHYLPKMTPEEAANLKKLYDDCILSHRVIERDVTKSHHLRR